MLVTGNITVGTAAAELAQEDRAGTSQRALMLQSAADVYVGNASVTADGNAVTGGWKIPAGSVWSGTLEPGEKVYLRAGAAGVVVNFCWSDV